MMHQQQEQTQERLRKHTIETKQGKSIDASENSFVTLSLNVENETDPISIDIFMRDLNKTLLLFIENLSTVL